jgi:hypothetical protein
MPRWGPTATEIEDRFYECLKGTGRGLTYSPLVKRYAERVNRTERTAKTHLKLLLGGIVAGTVTSVARYKGPEGWLYGTPEDDSFVQAREDAERPVVDRPAAIANLGGVFQGSPVRSEWTNCPITNRIIRTTVVTIGVGDFMECGLCHRAHFLGINPKMKDRRLYAWQVDPLVNADDYEDALTRESMGHPAMPGRTQQSRIERIRNGGHYVGLRFRTSWDKDPGADLEKRGLLKPGTGLVVHIEDFAAKRSNRLSKLRRSRSKGRPSQRPSGRA